MNLWQLPQTARIGEREYTLHTDYRDVLEIFSYLDDEELPVAFRWRIALGLFFEEEIPEEDLGEAASYFSWFISCGETQQRGEKLLCWQQDAPLIVAEVNRVAGQEIRALEYLHWWTFLGWFHTIGEGRLSTVVALRKKLRRGQPLESWEKTFYRENKAVVDIQRQYSRQELQERQRLQQLLQ